MEISECYTEAVRARQRRKTAMCGICGFIGEEKAMEEKQRILENMLGTIRHRGPDGKGICMDNTAALGFCRLSLVDPEGGAQPM